MLPFHPYADIFPLIEGKAFDDLVADIKANGLLEPIILLDGKILDGRNRYRAALKAGVFDEAHDVHLYGDGSDPLTWVLSKNLHRRHLDESQRAAVGAKLETLGHGGNRNRDGQDASLQLDRATVAGMVNVSARSIASAKKVRNEGAPELFSAIEQGKVKASVAERLLTLPKARQREVVTGLDARKLPTVAKQAAREATEQRLASKQRALPTTLYGVILADPAWRFEPYSRDTGLDRAADNHYPTQETGTIKALPVGTLAAPDCVLFLWATAPMLPDALATMRFWGFEYRSHLIWRKAEDIPGSSRSGKPVLGTGYWFRNGHELLLVGVRGNVPAPAMGTQWPSIVDAAPRKHSQKPDWAHAMIEAYFPNLRKIELNARAAREGWDRWGNEAPDNSPETASGGGAVEPETAAALGGTDPAAVGSRPATSSPLAGYAAAVAASSVARGAYSKATAEPILRAAYAVEPVVPLARVADDTGVNKKTLAVWAFRLGLSDVERRSTNGLATTRRARAELVAGGG